MSTLIVEVCKIENVMAHENADALELAHIKGWQCVIPKGRYAPGDLVTYIPIDAVIPAEHSDRWGITKYLSNSRVRCARLRGEPSFGVIVEREDPGWIEGRDVREFYGIEKYLPPIKTTAGDAERPHPLFIEYTDVENLRNFPDVLMESESIICTEKIHGTSCRFGLIEGEWMAGSMSVRRKRPDVLEGNLYWLPMTVPGIPEMIASLGERYRQVIVFGEVFGSKVQSLDYGQKNGALGFRAFDLFADGKYLDAPEFFAWCRGFGVPTVPVLYRGAYCLEKIKALSDGPTTLDAAHIREGVVVRPQKERIHPKVGRVCLKYIGDSYLLAKNVSDSHDM